MVRIITLMAAMASGFAVYASAVPAVAEPILERGHTPTTKPLATGYSNYLRNGVECAVMETPKDASNALFHAVCEFENDPAGVVAVLLGAAKQNCLSEGGSYDQNLG